MGGSPLRTKAMTCLSPTGTMRSSLASTWVTCDTLIGWSVAQILTGRLRPQKKLSQILNMNLGPKKIRLPRVVSPGDSTGLISQAAYQRWGLPPSCEMVAGTSDSIAAFLATGADTVGTGVTSLGSTLVIKMLSATRVDDSERGVYSHRLGDAWLVGGASNVGCAVLRSEGFSNDELASLEGKIDPKRNTPYKYYPLVKPGERFPVNDPKKLPVLDPKPSTRAEYLQAILEGISKVESSGYETLTELGASPLERVLTCGGGAANMPWTAMRERLLSVPATKAHSTEASYGLALLAIDKLKQDLAN
mmetsp:Transcript_8256/g.10432  ORF Transcript_8256/g.10432 Transcript_8256/m.10432 type:complete len:305 (-) Transcript_8256:173-1087(-)